MSNSTIEVPISTRSIFAFTGPEGSGKTTQSHRLSMELGKPYVTTGDTIRYLADKDPGPLGEECRVMFANHTYLNGDSLLKILENRFSKNDVKEGLILDGGLRTIEETVNFPRMLSQSGLTLQVVVFYLRMAEEITYKRLLDGPDARRRKDDTREAIASRLAMFNLNLDKRLKFIKDQPGWQLVDIDAAVSIDNVYNRIIDKISCRG